MEKEAKYLTGSGVEIFSYKNPSASSFYISLFLRAGSMYERVEDSGITHFLEHTLVRNVNALMDGELYPLLDRYGIEFNASTYSEMVQFYVYGAKAHFDIGAKIISMLLSPIVLTPEEIRTECSRIKAEIRENDERTSLSTFTNGIVNAGTSLAGSITGTLASVSKITRRRLEDYRREVFTRENVFFYVTGAFSDGDIRQLGDLVDAVALPSGAARTNIAPMSQNFFRREGRVYIKNADFTMVRFTFDMDTSRLSVPVTDLIYDILLGGYNSRFFIEMSERRGLFYDISGATERYKNIGTLTFSYEVRPDAIYEAVDITLELLYSMCTELIPPDECMKAGYVDNAYMLYDDVRELNFSLAYDNHIMSLGYSSLAERAAAYDAISPLDIRAAAREIFLPSNLTLTLKGNKKRIVSARIEDSIRRYAEKLKV